MANEKVYEAPALKEIGSLEELTLQPKQRVGGDGVSFMGLPSTS